MTGRLFASLTIFFFFSQKCHKAISLSKYRTPIKVKIYKKKNSIQIRFSSNSNQYSLKYPTLGVISKFPSPNKPVLPSTPRPALRRSIIKIRSASDGARQGRTEFFNSLSPAPLTLKYTNRPTDNVILIISGRKGAKTPRHDFIPR